MLLGAVQLSLMAFHWMPPWVAGTMARSVMAEGAEPPPVTVMVSFPKTPDPSVAVAVTFTVPVAAAVSKPEELIVAFPVKFVTAQVTAWLAALAGNTAADICRVD